MPDKDLVELWDYAIMPDNTEIRIQKIKAIRLRDGNFVTPCGRMKLSGYYSDFSREDAIAMAFRHRDEIIKRLEDQIAELKAAKVVEIDY